MLIPACLFSRKMTASAKKATAIVPGITVFESMFLAPGVRRRFSFPFPAIFVFPLESRAGPPIFLSYSDLFVGSFRMPYASFTFLANRSASPSPPAFLSG